MRFVYAVFLLVLGFACAAPASACDLPQPTGPVVLTVEGLIQGCNDGLEARFDMAMLEKLPKTVIRTANPWEKGVVSYEGVLLRDLLAFVSANGTSLSITALNDFHADLPVADTNTIDVILAYKREGAYMPVREKGPLFVIFPFSDYPALAVESRFAQSVWQVARITVK